MLRVHYRFHCGVGYFLLGFGFVLCVRVCVFEGVPSHLNSVYAQVKMFCEFAIILVCCQGKVWTKTILLFYDKLALRRAMNSQVSRHDFNMMSHFSMSVVVNEMNPNLR